MPQLHPAARTLLICSKNASLNVVLPLFWLKAFIPVRKIIVNKQAAIIFFIIAVLTINDSGSLIWYINSYQRFLVLIWGFLFRFLRSLINRVVMMIRAIATIRIIIRSFFWKSSCRKAACCWSNTVFFPLCGIGNCCDLSFFAATDAVINKIIPF